MTNKKLNPRTREEWLKYIEERSVNHFNHPDLDDAFEWAWINVLDKSLKEGRVTQDEIDRDFYELDDNEVFEEMIDILESEGLVSDEA